MLSTDRPLARERRGITHASSLGTIVAIALIASILFLAVICLILYFWHWRPRKRQILAQQETIRQLEERGGPLPNLQWEGMVEEPSCWPRRFRGQSKDSQMQTQYTGEPKFTFPVFPPAEEMQPVSWTAIANASHRNSAYTSHFEAPLPPLSRFMVDGISQPSTATTMQTLADADLNQPPPHMVKKQSSFIDRFATIRSYLSMSSSSSQSTNTKSGSLNLSSISSRERRRTPQPSPRFAHLRRESSRHLLPDEVLPDQEEANPPASPVDSSSHGSHSHHGAMQPPQTERHSYLPTHTPSFNDSLPSIPLVPSAEASASQDNAQQSGFVHVPLHKVSPFNVDFSLASSVPTSPRQVVDPHGHEQLTCATETQASISREPSRRSRVRFSSDRPYDLSLPEPTEPQPQMEGTIAHRPSFNIIPATAAADGSFDQVKPPPSPFLDFESSSGGSVRTRTPSGDSSFQESYGQPLRSKWSRTTLPSIRTTPGSVLSLRDVLQNTEVHRLRSQWSQTTLPSVMSNSPSLNSAHDSHDYSDYGSRMPSVQATQSTFSSIQNSPVDGRFWAPSRAPSSPLSSSPVGQLHVQTNYPPRTSGEVIYDSPTESVRAVSELQFRNSADYYEAESRRASTGSRLLPPLPEQSDAPLVPSSPMDTMPHPIGIVERVLGLNSPPVSPSNFTRQ